MLLLINSVFIIYTVLFLKEEITEPSISPERLQKCGVSGPIPPPESDPLWVAMQICTFIELLG